MIATILVGAAGVRGSRSRSPRRNQGPERENESSEGEVSPPEDYDEEDDDDADSEEAMEDSDASGHNPLYDGVHLDPQELELDVDRSRIHMSGLVTVYE